MSLDVTALLAHLVFVYVQITNDLTVDWYDQHVCATIPKKWFLAIWVVVLALIVASGYLYFTNSEHGEYFIVATVLYIANVIMVKVWFPLFFSKDRMHMGTALFVSITLILTSGTLLILFALESVGTAILCMYGIYVAWTVFIVFSNYQWFIHNSDAVEEPEKKRIRPQARSSKGTARTRRLRGTLEV